MLNNCTLALMVAGRYFGAYPTVFLLTNGE